MEFEFALLNFIDRLHTPIADIFFKYFTRIGDFGAIWIVFTLIALAHPKSRKIGVVLAISLVIDTILCNAIIKPLVARIRPYEINSAIALLIEKQNDYSFPSGHTAASFAFTVPLIVLGQKKYWMPSLVLSILMAFSRMYLYVHFPTDILGGIIVGTVSGLVSYYCVKSTF